jgi:MFS family permease
MGATTIAGTNRLTAATTRRVPVWALIAPAQFAMAWGGNHFTPLLHMYEQRGNYSETATNLLLGVYVFGLIPSLLLAAALSERYGRRRVLLIGLLTSVGGSIVLAAGFPSFTLLCAGRMLSGISVGVAMSVGTSWMKELSAPPYEGDGFTLTAGARRPALTLTLGFGAGAGVSGVLAQWGPIPTVLPYLVQITIGLLGVAPLLIAPETAGGAEVHLRHSLRMPSLRNPRFLRVVLPTAPWVFTTAGVAYALLPEIVAKQLGGDVLIYATALCVLTLGCGALIQPQVSRLNAATGGRALTVGMIVIVVGLLVATASAALRSPAVALVTGPLLGCGYGIALVAGLGEVQRISGHAELAGMTGVFYSLTYVGFLLPTLVAAFTSLASYTVLLAAVTVLGCLCTLVAERGT